MGHIAEVDEHLDYEKFFNYGMPKEGLSNEEWRKLIGNRTWALMHGLIDHYPCEQCAEGGRVLVSGIHDMVNLSLGKGIFDFDSWKAFLEMVETAKKHNPHSPHFKHERLRDPDEFDPHSFRTVKEGKDLIVIGCPAGHYSGGSCEVGTAAQAILHRVGH